MNKILWLDCVLFRENMYSPLYELFKDNGPMIVCGKHDIKVFVPYN